MRVLGEDSERKRVFFFIPMVIKNKIVFIKTYLLK